MQTAEAQKDAPKVEPVFDGDDLPAGKLEDAEIARLVSLSSKAAYSRTDDIPVKPKESFEPRTLVTIAMEAQRRREAELQESATHEAALSAKSGDAEASDAIAEVTDDASAVATAANSPAGDAGAETGATVDVADDEAQLSGDDEASAGEPELSEEEIVAAAAAAKLKAEYERGLAEGRAMGQETGHKAGHDTGYEAGRAAGQAEATAQLETAIQGFEKATMALASAASLDLDALTAGIHDAILSLASERAGMAIADMPEAFAGRIESILATIKQGADHPQIRLNPDDLLALKPIIATREKLQNCTLDADETLAPGDVRLVIDGIGIEDELHRRVSGKATVQPTDVTATEPSIHPVDAGATITEEAEAEPDIAQLDNVDPANAETAMASTAGDIAPGESSASPESAGEGGFSVGLKPKAEAEDAGTPAAGTADVTEADQS